MVSAIKRKKQTAVLLAVFITLSGNAQQMAGTAALSPSKEDINLAYTPAQQDLWQEDESKRTTYSSTWHKPDGAIVVQYGHQPINYTDTDGNLQHIDPSFHASASGWAAMHQPHPVLIDELAQITTNYGNHVSTVFGHDRIFNEQPLIVSEIKMQDEILIASFNETSVLLEMQPRTNGVKYQYRLSEAPALFNEAVIISEEISIPVGSTIQPDTQRGRWIGDVWYGNLLVLNAEGDVLSFIQGTTCYDAAMHYHLAGYKWQKTKDNNTYRLSTLIDTGWLLSNTTQYPVVIDPLVTGPLAAWGNEWMPSCVIPSYNVDSIYVTIPGEITVTNFFVTGSFFADPFTFSIMEDGAMYYSSPCGATGLFEVVPPNGDLPGTAYLEAFDMRVPLTCCYPQSCSDQSFWLKMHLGRYIPAGSCDTLNVYYTPTTLWPFTAYIEGHTVETFASEFTVQNTPICSNECVFDAVIRARYGVPPFTFTHPWMADSVVVTLPEGCDFANTVEHMDLTVPDCPVYCPTYDEVVVPPPTITDACGNTVPDLPVDILSIKAAPDVVTPPEPFYLCSGVEETILLSSCVADAVINWSGPDSSSIGNITALQWNTTDESSNLVYTLQATAFGCSSEVVEYDVVVLPNPIADYTVSPVPAIVLTPITFTDASTSAVDDIEFWQWDFGDFIVNETDVTLSFDSVGYYTACLLVTTEQGCIAETCKEVFITSSSVIGPNIFTPNSDGKNDTLEFVYLEYFPDNHLDVWNRWGNLIYSADNYNNNWTGDGHPDGTYYYLLDVGNGQVLEGWLMLLAH